MCSETRTGLHGDGGSSTLADTGYRVLDSFLDYAPQLRDVPLATCMLRSAKKLVFRLSPRLTASLLDGGSMMVLTRRG